MYKQIFLSLLLFVGISTMVMAQPPHTHHHEPKAVVNPNEHRVGNFALPSQQIERITYRQFAMGSQSMDKREYRDFLKQTCPAAYQKYRSGQTLKIVGWSMFGAGMFMNMLEWYDLVDFYADNDWVAHSLYDQVYEDSKRWRLLFDMSRIGLTLGSVPCLIVGYANIRKSVNVYNRKCAAPVLSYRIAPTACSLSLTF